ncbi:MAG: PLDc N-terminal domain-containing protein [Cyclobacteriaceae bacterium]|nr:PLDc N-terminal domain-containing protein [Cyclobacteriaceae bacterium]
MQNIIYIAFLVIFIWTIYDIWTSSLDSGKKILWTIVSLLLGFIGTIIYVLVGRKR